MAGVLTYPARTYFLSVREERQTAHTKETPKTTSVHSEQSDKNLKKRTNKHETHTGSSILRLCSLTIRPYISEELLTLGRISMGIPKYLTGDESTSSFQSDAIGCY